MPLTASYHIYPCGDHALTVEWASKIDPEINTDVMNLFAAVKAAKINGIKDIIPAYHTLTVVYDTAALKKQVNTKTVYEWMSKQVAKVIDDIADDNSKAGKKIQIPVCYDLSLAPDLALVADIHSMNIEEIIAIHSSVTYRVYMIGFLPGFAYMGTIDERIITARKDKPRTLVPAGSVGIAGGQTGIYPFDSPGGWQILGQTPVTMFDAAKERPCYLQPGDLVQFYAVTVTEFKKIKADGIAHS